MTTTPPVTTVSVVIITFARPQYVADCLSHLDEMTERPHQVIVVDGSPDDRTRELIETQHAGVDYIRHSLGRGTMPESRQLGLAAATGEVVAFIDDDAYVARDWLVQLTRAYADPTVSGVGGRADNGRPEESTEGIGSIGRLLPNGDLTGYFAADPQRRVKVDHFLGANQSYRRTALEAIGGIRGNYPGTCLREESDTCLRLTATGHQLIYDPRVLVRHVAAPYQIGGQRFDRRYLYYSRRNHVMLLARVFGWRTPYLRRYYVTALQAQGHYFRLVTGLIGKGIGEDGNRASLSRRLTSPIILTRSVVEVAGLIAGIWAALDGRRRDRRAGVGTP
ncbi:glycosyltransferase family 2 protein [Microbacterium kyungheense]|uniref:Glycosyl transferase family 2 n=1 Tax=Microbacterium kyungheense TaxID=1263636 RepID=A0A543ES09_9MICO|nr:glycosyltransferase family 2 protein [Microbacterium kyungheense]TQM24309.1 glycosyl transferase family 2 [Microbacterium kyungheense]